MGYVRQLLGPLEGNQSSTQQIEVWGLERLTSSEPFNENLTSEVDKDAYTTQNDGPWKRWLLWNDCHSWYPYYCKLIVCRSFYLLHVYPWPFLFSPPFWMGLAYLKPKKHHNSNSIGFVKVSYYNSTFSIVQKLPLDLPEPVGSHVGENFRGLLILFFWPKKSSPYNEQDQQSWESKSNPTNANPPRSKALLRGYGPPWSLNKASLRSYSLEWDGLGGGGPLLDSIYKRGLSPPSSTEKLLGDVSRLPSGRLIFCWRGPKPTVKTPG